MINDDKDNDKDKDNDNWCHYSGMPSPMAYSMKVTTNQLEDNNPDSDSEHSIECKKIDEVKEVIISHKDTNEGK
jgi:hypothetical protein